MYFQYINRTTPVVDEEAFRHQLLEGNQSMALTSVICALGALHSRATVARVSGEEGFVGDELAAAARQRTLSEPFLLVSRLRCLYLLSVYELHRGRAIQAWLDLCRQPNPQTFET
jgi:hypothetical protein